MICGHSNAYQLLETFLQKTHHDSLFLLLIGPDNIGKTTCALQATKPLLGSMHHQDLLHIKNMSHHLGKKHSLKVDNTDWIDYTENGRKHRYLDQGAKQIREWLTRSSAGDKKILLIENINRMTIGAANGLLKSLEEPLPGRVIIATAPAKDLVLSTILSRAIIIPFQVVADDEIIARVAKDYEHIESEKLNAIITFAGGRPGRAYSMLQDIESTESLIQLFEQWKHLYHNGTLHTRYKHLQAIEKAGSLVLCRDAMISYLIAQQDIQSIDHLIQSIIMGQSNINKDTTLFWLAEKVQSHP